MPTQLINLSTRLRVETGECVAIAGFIVFFFSSRRLHTSSLCDWSSDVCSSDLLAAAGADREAQSQDVGHDPAAHAQAAIGRRRCAQVVSGTGRAPEEPRQDQ